MEEQRPKKLYVLSLGSASLSKPCLDAIIRRHKEEHTWKNWTEQIFSKHHLPV